MAITRLGACGISRSPYGSFAGKVAAPIVVATIQFGKKFYRESAKKFRSIKEFEMRQEEFELMTIIKIIGKYLL